MLVFFFALYAFFPCFLSFAFQRSIQLNEERFISIMRDIIGEVEFLQNNPTQNLIPQEQRGFIESYMLL